MKLATSSGDFSHYYSAVSDKIKAYAGTNFKYLNFEQARTAEYLYAPQKMESAAEAFKEAAAFAGVQYVVSHAPCLHNPVLNDEETYKRNIFAIRNSIKMCHLLGISRIVVHACPSKDFTVEEFYKYNKKFYADILEVAEQYNIMILTENWDNSETHFSTGKQLRDFIDYIDHPLFGACWDTAHGNIDETARKIGQYENIVAIGDKLHGMHISDNFGDCHHHTFPFAGIINFDSIVQGLIDVDYDGYFTFEAAYTLLHQNNMPYRRKEWEHNGKTVTTLLNPSAELKQKAVNLLYEIGKYVLETYGIFEE